MKTKLITALSAYAALAVLADFTLDGGLLRNAVWVLMGGLAIKTYVAYRAGWHQSLDDEESGRVRDESVEEDRHR